MKAKKFGLTATQLKWIALAFMTIDHLSARGEAIPVVASYSTLMCRLGRIAAPLFLFVLTESVRHTRSKVKLIFRLYIAGVLTGLFEIIANAIFHNILIFTPGNIFFTYFYVAVYIYLIEGVIKARSEKNTKKQLIFIAGIFSTVIPQLLHWWFDTLVLSLHTSILLRAALSSVAPATFYIEYSLLFVFMGVAMYFIRSRKMQCVVFFCFCVVSFLGTAMGRNLWPFNDFFGDGQFWMVLALPIMLLYNGERGKDRKTFFYVYYPVHRYLIALLSTVAL